MIDIEKVREAFHTLHPEYDTANGGTHIIHDYIFEALTELDRLQKREQQEQSIEKIFGFDINEIRLICVLINERFMSKDNFHEVLRNFQKAYQKGYYDCHEIMNKELSEQFKKRLER